MIGQQYLDSWLAGSSRSSTHETQNLKHDQAPSLRSNAGSFLGLVRNPYRKNIHKLAGFNSSCGALQQCALHSFPP